MTYKLHSDNQMWITSTERDEVLKVMDFVDGGEIITLLSDGRLEDFEDAEKQFVRRDSRRTTFFST